MAEPHKAYRDEHSGKGGSYEIKGGKRVLVRRAGQQVNETKKEVKGDGAEVREQAATGKD